MASVNFTNLWVSDPLDNSLSYEFKLADLKVSPERSGEVRRQADGRLRLVTRVGQRQRIEVTLVAADRNTVAMVEAWEGRAVLVRDPMGRRFYATFFEPNITEDAADTGLAVISLTLTEVTVDETQE